jgi:hypothetical protein
VNAPGAHKFACGGPQGHLRHETIGLAQDAGDDEQLGCAFVSLAAEASFDLPLHVVLSGARLGGLPLDCVTQRAIVIGECGPSDKERCGTCHAAPN